MRADPARWVGVPFAYGGRGPDTFDCYGLIMTILAERGVVIPDYNSPSDQATIAAMMGNQLNLWREVPRQAGAVVLLRPDRLASHVGYMLDHERMIHAWGKTGGVTIQRLDVWRHKLMGFYEFVG